jgi:hypothetical protein
MIEVVLEGIRDNVSVLTRAVETVINGYAKGCVRQESVDSVVGSLLTNTKLLGGYLESEKCDCEDTYNHTLGDLVKGGSLKTKDIEIQERLKTLGANFDRRETSEVSEEDIEALFALLERVIDSPWKDGVLEVIGDQIKAMEPIKSGDPVGVGADGKLKKAGPAIAGNLLGVAHRACRPGNSQAVDLGVWKSSETALGRYPINYNPFGGVPVGG